MKKYQTERRQKALERLKLQLKRGEKPAKIEGKESNKMEKLTEKDTNRIKAEITKLQERV